LIDDQWRLTLMPTGLTLNLSKAESSTLYYAGLGTNFFLFL